MRGLTILVAAADPARYRAVLELAAAQAALGGRCRLHLHGDAVALLDAADPDLQALRTEAAALGAAFSACQTGLGALVLPAGVEPDGLVSLLSSLGEDQLVVA